MDTAPSSSSSSTVSSTVDNIDELSEKNVDVFDSGNNPIPEKEEAFDVTESRGDTEKDMDVTDSGRDRFDPFHTGSSNMSGEKSENSTASQLREATSTDWSLLRSLAGLVIRSLEFQVSLMISFIRFPPWLISSFLSFVFEPCRTMRRGRRYLLSRVIELCDLVLNDDKPASEAVRRLAWGLFWAMYVGIMLVALLVSAFVISGFVITYLAHEPLVIKESLNFDYTKNSPEAYVPITSCDSSCKGSLGTGKKENPPDDRTEITVSMTLPESEYNRNLGMFQVRVDFLSSSGQILASSSRPYMVGIPHESETDRYPPI